MLVTPFREALDGLRKSGTMLDGGAGRLRFLPGCHGMMIALINDVGEVGPGRGESRRAFRGCRQLVAAMAANAILGRLPLPVNRLPIRPRAETSQPAQPARGARAGDLGQPVEAHVPALSRRAAEPNKWPACVRRSQGKIVPER